MTVLLLLTICFCCFAFAVIIGKVIALGNPPPTRPVDVAAFASRANQTSVGRASHVRLRVTAPVPLATGLPQAQRGRLHVEAPS